MESPETPFFGGVVAGNKQQAGQRQACRGVSVAARRHARQLDKLLLTKMQRRVMVVEVQRAGLPSRETEEAEQGQCATSGQGGCHWWTGSTSRAFGAGAKQKRNPGQRRLLARSKQAVGRVII